MNCQSDSMREAWPGCHVFLKALSLDALDVRFPLEKTCVMRALRPLPELVESVLADFKTAAALQHRQAACLLRWDAHIWKHFKKIFRLMIFWVLCKYRSTFVLRSQWSKAFCPDWRRPCFGLENSQQQYSDIKDLRLQFSVSVVDLVEYLWNWGKAPHLAPRAMLSADLKKCWVRSTWNRILGAFRVGCFTDETSSRSGLLWKCRWTSFLYRFAVYEFSQLLLWTFHPQPSIFCHFDGIFQDRGFHFDIPEAITGLFPVPTAKLVGGFSVAKLGCYPT